MPITLRLQEWKKESISSLRNKHLHIIHQSSEREKVIKIAKRE